MAPYYIDPGRCFEVPFFIPLPDRNAMAVRLASIRLIMRNARERQSLSCAEHRRKISTRPTQYRDKAKSIMNCGRLKRFVGNLNEHYFDHLDFHDCLNRISPLTIQVPSLCSPLSPPPPCLFGPPRQHDFNAIIRSNLSWSQFAAPAPAGWREQFLHERNWELGVEHRAWNVYSEEERKAEYAALQSQRRHLEVCLQTDTKTPPPLQRKLPIPLPSTTLSPLLPYGRSVQLKCDGEEYNMFLPTNAQRRYPIEHPKSRPPLACHSSRQRPSLHVVIPGTEHFKAWLTGGGRLCYSPLSAIGTDAPYPSVLLNANHVRAYLDAMHGPHKIIPGPESLQLAYPQSPRQQFFPSKLVIEISAERMSSRHVAHHNAQKSPFSCPSGSVVLFPNPSMAPPSAASKLHIHQPQPMYPLKRKASQDTTAVSNGFPKKPRLQIFTSAINPQYEY
ncbi:hypothetical protein BJV78DRAFT_265030 [Lactifluus subvellereus]|nr:hypothetical protein BJV78DRAFT_265030 [Lactifluus subvellereus]